MYRWAMEPFGLAIDLLIRGGPWAVTVFVAWAYWQKDKQQQKERVSTLNLIERYITTIGKLEGAVASMATILNIVASRERKD